MRIVIADDQPQVRSAVRLLLEALPDISIVGEARDMGEAVALLCQEQPDVLLLDWELPMIGGPDELSALRRCAPGLMVLALSSRSEARRQALDAGVEGFVSKGDPPESLLTALAEAAAR